MGEVIAVFRILPDSPDGFDAVSKKVRALKPARLDEEPVAFGLKAIIATFIIPDEGGSMDQLENRLGSIKGTQSVETVRVSRSL